MSWINLVEVQYRTIRDHGREEADRVVSELRPRINEHLPGEGAQLLTGDPEILEADGLPCRVADLRAQ